MPHCKIQSRCFSEFCIKARELAIVKLMYMYGGLSAVDDQLHVRVDRSLIWILTLSEGPKNRGSDFFTKNVANRNNRLKLFYLKKLHTRLL